MKIVLSLKELEAGKEFVQKLGVNLAQLNDVVKDNQTVSIIDIYKRFDYTIDDRLTHELSKNPDVMYVTKVVSGDDVTFEFVLSEEFVVETNKLYGDLAVDVINTIKQSFIVLKALFKSKFDKYLDKFKLK